MANVKRKPNRGKSWRNLYLALKRKKEAKEKPKEPIFKTEDDLFKRIGSGSDYSTEYFYPWSTVHSNYMLDKEDEPLQMRSLKDICAIEIAQNHDMINQELLRSGNWSIWNLVWKYIIRWRRDNFKTFQIFADVFSGQKGFECHDELRSYPDSRYKTLVSSTLPNNKSHRIERLYGNLKFNGFIRTINHSRFDNLVVLEISKGLNDDDLLQLTNLSNLTALKIVQQDHQLPDTIINSWCSALKSSKWTKLQVLSIPEISQASMIKLQKHAYDTRLLYIEVATISSRFQPQRDWPDVDTVHWEVLKDRAITERSLGMKFQVLVQKYKIDQRSILPDQKTILLDFNIVDSEFESLDGISTQRDFDELWNLGEVQGNYTGFILKGIPIKPKIEKRQIEPKAKSVKKFKGNPKKTSLKSFFDL
ncbi:hypothetical protein BN7_1269 [Wickerhamomyces ciferrii]|uniref:Uncharacterized protein n=1 Tax=Wickerhamomyces ciferrii (strain ATCC 14091 / BCRC 22168 / CBS 111 / JCM 3599 / NBRC 0793 / NRRL Y-1031 F-60-10) TaxID=1206466 RepID=K0K9W9_WICCF|nr:uncharacterized protein BN7_1269 [Wickerhamomyces ciferrii]CCH41730.1 hypothetical protein BN7_1269 [Wickerhamomyces ciferrii]